MDSTIIAACSNSPTSRSALAISPANPRLRSDRVAALARRRLSLGPIAFDERVSRVAQPREGGGIPGLATRSPAAPRNAAGILAVRLAACSRVQPYWVVL